MALDLFAPESVVVRCEAALAAAVGRAQQLPLLLELAWYLRQSQPQRSQQLCQTASELIASEPKLDNGHGQARLKLMHAEAQWLNMQLEPAQQEADLALQTFTQLDDFLGQADAHWVMGYVYAELGRIDLFDLHMQQAANAAQIANDSIRVEMTLALRASWAVFRDLPSALAQWNNVFPNNIDDKPLALAACIADYFFTAASLQGDFGSAIEYGMRIHQAALQTGQMRTAIISATNIGDSFNSLNDHESALEWMQIGLDLARKTAWPGRIGGCLMQTAETLRKLGRLEAAQDMLNQALSLLAALPGSRSYALSLNYRGQLALDRKDYVTALDSFSQLQVRASALRQRDFICEAFRGQAGALLYLKRPEEALAAAQEALNIATQQNATMRQMLVVWVLAEIYSQYDLPVTTELTAASPALHYLQQALHLAEKIEGYTVAPELFEDMGRAYAKIGQYQAAYEIGLQAGQARQKMQSQYASKRALAIQIRQQTERARTESAHLLQLAEAEARRAEVLQQTNLTLANLGAIGQEITAHLAQDAVLEALNRHVHNLLDATCFTIYLMDADGKSMTSAIDIEAGRALPTDQLMLDNPVSNCVRCIHQRCEILLDADPDEDHPTQVPGTLITLSALFAPLAIGERVLGVMTIQTAQRYAYGERERMIFRTLCAYGAIALDNAHAYQQLADTLATLRQTETKLMAQERKVRQHAEQLAQANLALQENAEKLRLAKQKAEEATQLKSEFLANMSHEIRTPMNAVIGMAHLALRTGLTAKQQDYLNKIHRAGLSLLGIINDILDFSKIEAGKLEVEHVAFSLDEVLANVASLSSQKAVEKGLEYLFDVGPDVPRHLLGDGLRLGQVLINLVNNAIKFTHHGEVCLTCRVLPSSLEGQKLRLHFAVRDTGIGMSEQQVARLFQPFSQADGSTTRKYGGTGLGLSISQHLVQLMGGKIGVQSQLGRGSSFSFTLDFVSASSAKPSFDALPAILRQGRVLVVDDNHAACEILCNCLEPIVAQVDCVNTAQQALQALLKAELEGQAYLLVLTDLQLPEQDGLALVRAMRQEVRLQHQPEVILVTAFGREEVQDQAEQAGVAGFLFKPINFSLLQQALASVFVPHQRMVVTGNVPVQQFVNCRILLAEDNEINQQIAVELLQLVGIEVDVVESGRAAVEKLYASATSHYQMILMDLEMPEMDGHEATILIRRDTKFADLPIIAMTAHALAEVRERCLAEGMQDYLCKPIEPEVLYASLARWLPQHLRLAPAAFVASHENAGPAIERIQLQIPGLDEERGLQAVAGNLALYCRLLQQFAQSHASTVEAIFQALDQQGGAAEAMRLLHSLRGVAANLGANPLAQAAAEIEAELEAERTPNTASLLTLSSHMQQLLDGIRKQFQDTPKTLLQPIEHVVDSTKTFQELHRLLEEGHADALDYFEQFKAQLASNMGSVELLQLAKYIQQYQFDDALRMLLQRSDPSSLGE